MKSANLDAVPSSHSLLLATMQTMTFSVKSRNVTAALYTSLCGVVEPTQFFHTVFATELKSLTGSDEPLKD